MRAPLSFEERAGSMGALVLAMTILLQRNWHRQIYPHRPSWMAGGCSICRRGMPILALMAVWEQQEPRPTLIASPRALGWSSPRNHRPSGSSSLFHRPTKTVLKTCCGSDGFSAKPVSVCQHECWFLARAVLISSKPPACRTRHRPPKTDLAIAVLESFRSLLWTLWQAQ